MVFFDQEAIKRQQERDETITSLPLVRRSPTVSPSSTAAVASSSSSALRSETNQDLNQTQQQEQTASASSAAANVYLAPRRITPLRNVASTPMIDPSAASEQVNVNGDESSTFTALLFFRYPCCSAFNSSSPRPQSSSRSLWADVGCADEQDQLQKRTEHHLLHTRQQGRARGASARGGCKTDSPRRIATRVGQAGSGALAELPWISTAT